MKTFLALLLAATSAALGTITTYDTHTLTSATSAVPWLSFSRNGSTVTLSLSDTVPYSQSAALLTGTITATQVTGTALTVGTSMNFDQGRIYSISDANGSSIVIGNTTSVLNSNLSLYSTKEHYEIGNGSGGTNDGVLRIFPWTGWWGSGLAMSTATTGIVTFSVFPDFGTAVFKSGSSPGFGVTMAKGLSVSGSISLNGNIAATGTLSGTVMRTGTTSGGTLVSPTITTPSGLVATDIGGTAATLGSNNAFLGTNNTAPNQVGQPPGISTMLVKSQSDALYPKISPLAGINANISGTTNAAIVTSTTAAVLESGTYMVQGQLWATQTTGSTGINIGVSYSQSVVGHQCTKIFYNSITSNGEFTAVAGTYVTGTFSSGGRWADYAKGACAEVSAWIIVPSTTNVFFYIGQRNSADAANPAVLSASNSYLQFLKL